MSAVLSLAPPRAAYLARVLSVYLRPGKGPLSFWYETPEFNDAAFGPGVGQYYMTFAGKARYAGPFDDDDVPMLEYRGTIGRQYNPIAIAQYGLASFNQYQRSREPAWRRRFLRCAEWLATRLTPNAHGVPVWTHAFGWPYRETLVAPWYSGLAQGSGVSLLVRAAQETGGRDYASAAEAAFRALTVDVADGGVIVTGSDGRPWIEEYIVDPPSHILNGFVWALWGVWDFARWSGDHAAARRFDRFVDTIERALPRYDCGFWSLYELPVHGGAPMLASPYYHRLHIVQLRVLARMTGRAVFNATADRWARYDATRRFRARAVAHKAWFKLWRY